MKNLLAAATAVLLAASLASFAGPAAAGGGAPPVLGGHEQPPAALDPLGAYTHWYADSTDLRPDAAEAGAEGWRDVIGEDIFDTKGIAARWADGKLHLALVTNFPDRQVESAGRAVSPADLALDLDGDGSLETGIVLSAIRATGDLGVTRAPNIRQGAAYRVLRWHSPATLLRATYGAGWRWTGPDGKPMPQSEVPVWVAEGEERQDLDVTVDWRPIPGTDMYAVLVTLAHRDGLNRLHNVPAVWGTAVCGNDVVFANVSRLENPDFAPSGAMGTSATPIPGPRWNSGLGVVPTSAAAPAAGLPGLHGRAGAPPLLSAADYLYGPGSLDRGLTGNAGGDAGGSGSGLSGSGGSNPGGGDPSIPGAPGAGGEAGAGGDPGSPVTPVPVPPSAILLAFAFGGLVLLARRRRRA